jgi:hypothetical protein
MTIETALDFVRECCGYTKAEINRKYSDKRRLWLDGTTAAIFDHNSVQNVLKYAKAWADRRGQWFDLTYSSKQKGWGCDCAGIDDWDEDFCEVIMRTLVKAERKMADN